MTEERQTFKTLCVGGLDTTDDFLKLSDEKPGACSRLINYEPGLYGGYRRINGFQYLDTTYTQIPGVGKTLFTAIYAEDIYACREDSGTGDYYVYKYNPATGWGSNVLTLTRTASGVKRIRFVRNSVAGPASIMFVDGVSTAFKLTGSTWTAINGAGYPPDPKYVENWKGRIWFAGMSANPNRVTCSDATTDDTFTGANDWDLDFEVVAIKAFRDELYVFGQNDIAKIVPDATSTFATQTVTKNIGCLATDSVIEIGGDLVFLSPDGLRPVAGTARIGDVEIESISKSIQSFIKDTLSQGYDLDYLSSVVIREKSQFRYFFYDGATVEEETVGLLGALRQNDRGVGWEFSSLLGIKPTCTDSDFINSAEYIIHGDADGHIYRQELGGTFNSNNIFSLMQTPFIDMGDPLVRKRFDFVRFFIRSEGAVTFNFAAKVDYNSSNSQQPGNSTSGVSGAFARYLTTGSEYGDTTVLYGGTDPFFENTVIGSGFSVAFRIVNFDSEPSFTIQSYAIEYTPMGRR